MKCPKCGSHDGRVLETVQKLDATRRRRECLHCGNRFSTIERHNAAVKEEQDSERLQRLVKSGGLEPEIAEAIVNVERRKREIVEEQRRRIRERERQLAEEAGLSTWGDEEPLDIRRELEGY